MHIEVIASLRDPSGVGAMAPRLRAPPSASAFAAVTGVRLRHVPFTPDRVKKAIAGVSTKKALAVRLGCVCIEALLSPCRLAEHCTAAMAQTIRNARLRSARSGERMKFRSLIATLLLPDP